MTLKRYFLILMAMLALAACSPEDEPVQEGNGQEQEGQEGGNAGEQQQADETTAGIEEVGRISATGASLYGWYSHAAATPDEKGFEWGTSEDNLSETVLSKSVVSGAAGMFSATLTGLMPNTIYWCRAFVKVTVDGVQKTYRSDLKLSFRTEEGEGQGGSGEGGEGGEGEGGEGGGPDTPPALAPQPGWFELPVVNSYVSNEGWRIDRENPDLYYAYHKSDIGTRNYTVCYNGAYHCPVWIAAPRHSIYSSGSGRSSYSFDPDIPKSVQQASTSGSTSGYNRGHMLGSAERTGSTLTNKQVFYVTNIAPQGDPWFNSSSGGWNPLEAFIDKFESSDTLYVVIGAYFEDFTDGYGNTATKKTALFMGSDVQIPTMFYYACLRTKSGNSNKSLKDCSRDEMMCAAFVRAHSPGTAGQAITKKEMMSIDALEALTGFDYFTAITNAPEDTFDPADWGLKQ